MSAYTAFIENGRITNAKDFLKLCLRDFGIMQEHYQDPLSLESVLQKTFDIESNGGYQRYVKNLNDEYQELKTLIKTLDDKEALDEQYNQYIENLKKDLNSYKQNKEEIIKKNKVYEKYIDEIQKWDCSPQYENIKKFAIEQCNSALGNISFYDKEIARYEEQLADPKSSFEKDMKAKLACIKEGIDMWAKSICRTVESLKERKEFFDGFMNELNKMD